MDFVWDHILNQQTLVFLLAFIGIFMGFAGNLKPLNDHRILMITIGLLEFEKVCPRCAPGVPQVFTLQFLQQSNVAVTKG